MAATKRAFLLCLVLLSPLLLPASAQTCDRDSYDGNFTRCSDLPVLNSTLYWNYDASAATVDIAYRAPKPQSAGWIAWGINPNRSRMVGTQALVAVIYANGSSKSWTAPITKYGTDLSEGELSFPVDNLRLSADNGNSMTIFATITLPANGTTTINHVWQESESIKNGIPGVHPISGPNQKSYGTLDLLSGVSTSSGGSKRRRRNIHGVLNAVSWGILMPLGVMIARYTRMFQWADPAWFYLHVICQFSAYVIGVAGWGTGLKLGSDSPGVTHKTHRNIGIVLFCLATLQVFALLLRPQKDHKYRMFWNVYHHAVGFAVIVLSIVNIFEGFDILDPADKWKRAYVGVIIGLGAVALVLEFITWGVVLRRRQKKAVEKSHYGGHGHVDRNHQMA